MSETENETDEKLEIISNAQRGCGYLREGSYLRADISANGTLPPFVTFVTPVPYLEKHYRGYVTINGDRFESANYVPTEPEGEFDNHLDRLTGSETTKPERIDNVAESKSMWSPDLLMWVGERYYPTPAKFIQEAESMGVNKRITLADPPIIIAGKTKLYLIHPKAIDNKSAGIIGYAYLTRTIYCTKKENVKKIPKWVNDLNKLRRIAIVRIGVEENSQKKL